MELKSIFFRLLDGIPLLLIAAALILSVYAAGYLLIYRRLMKGTKRLKFSRVLWVLLLISYLGVLALVTVLRPGESAWYAGRIYPLFYSYKSAWISFNGMEWRNLILNIAMFVPFGFLLPMAFAFFRTFWKTYLTGFVVTLAIEGLQFIFRMGVVECDDVLNNLLGTMIGYGFYAVFRLIADFVKKRKPSVCKTLALQIPLLGTVAAFAVIFAIYNGQELGNLKLESIVKATGFEIVSHKEYGAESGSAMVYKTDVLDKDGADRLAEEFFAGLSAAVDETRNDYYDGTAFYYSTDSKSFWVDYVGAVYNYTDFDVGFGNKEVDVKRNATDKEIMDVLGRYGVFLPKDITFRTDGDGVYYITARQSLENQMIYDGEIRCTYYANGVMGNIRNGIITGRPYKEVELISGQEALEKIRDGKVRISDRDLNGVRIELGDVELSYELDTKGFYQPVYVFEAYLVDPGAGEWEMGIKVPAVR